MSKPFDMDEFLRQGGNLINAELLCNEIDNFLAHFFELNQFYDTHSVYLDKAKGRYAYFCPLWKKDKKYTFEIGFGHDDDEDFSNEEQKDFKERLNIVKKNYSWEKQIHTNPQANKKWVWFRFDYNVDDITLENIKELAEKVKKALDDMKG